MGGGVLGADGCSWRGGARLGGAGLGWERGLGGSHSGRIFGVSWHLGERLELVRDPRVHFDGFAGE